MQTTISYPRAQSFWDNIAPKYAQKPVPDLAAYEEKLARVSSLLRSTDRVLEIGCGTGTTALRLAPCVAHMTATDLASKMIEIAQTKREKEAVTNVKFCQAEAADTVEGHPFDVITAFSLLHLIADIPRVLKSVREQLKPGGLFISKTECLQNRTFLMRALVPVLTAVGIAPRVTVLSTDDLNRLLREAGFEIEQTCYFGNNRSNPFIVARRPAF